MFFLVLFLDIFMLAFQPLDKLCPKKSFSRDFLSSWTFLGDLEDKIQFLRVVIYFFPELWTLWDSRTPISSQNGARWRFLIFKKNNFILGFVLPFFVFQFFAKKTFSFSKKKHPYWVIKSDVKIYFCTLEIEKKYFFWFLPKISYKI